jgi:hypothetical protein
VRLPSGHGGHGVELFAGLPGVMCIPSTVTYLTLNRIRFFYLALINAILINS